MPDARTTSETASSATTATVRRGAPRGVTSTLLAIWQFAIGRLRPLGRRLHSWGRQAFRSSSREVRRVTPWILGAVHRTETAHVRVKQRRTDVPDLLCTLAPPGLVRPDDVMLLGAADPSEPGGPGPGSSDVLPARTRRVPVPKRFFSFVLLTAIAIAIGIGFAVLAIAAAAQLIDILTKLVRSQ